MEARYLTDLEWRICHAVNIYVFRNGRDGEQPILVHIPPAKKKNMKTVLSVIQDRVKYPVGYAKYLFKMDGTRIKDPCELEMYNNYVVASNFEKHFKCASYGRKRSPLLVLNRESKHVRVLKLQNQNYYEWLLKKKAVGEERPPYIYPPYYTNENKLPQDLPLGKMGNYNPGEVRAPGCCYPPTLDGGRTYRIDSSQNYTVNTVTVDVNPDFREMPIPGYKKGMGKHGPHDFPGKFSGKHGKKLEPTPSDMVNANVLISDVTSQEVVSVTASSETDEQTRIARKHKEQCKSKQQHHHHHKSKGHRVHIVSSEEYQQQPQQHYHQERSVLQLTESTTASTQSSHEVMKKPPKHHHHHHHHEPSHKKGSKHRQGKRKEVVIAEPQLQQQIHHPMQFMDMNVPPPPPPAQFRDSTADARNMAQATAMRILPPPTQYKSDNQEILDFVDRAVNDPNGNVSVAPQKSFYYSPEKLADINPAGNMQPMGVSFVANPQQQQPQMGQMNVAPPPPSIPPQAAAPQQQWTYVQHQPPPQGQQQQIVQSMYAIESQPGGPGTPTTTTLIPAQSLDPSGVMGPYTIAQQQPQMPMSQQQIMHGLTMPQQVNNVIPTLPSQPALYQNGANGVPQCIMVPNNCMAPSPPPGTQLIALPSSSSQSHMQQVYQLGIVQQPNPQTCIQVDAKAMRQYVDNQKLIECRFQNQQRQNSSENDNGRGNGKSAHRKKSQRQRKCSDGTDITETEVDIPFTPLKTYRLDNAPNVTQSHSSVGQNERYRYRYERLPKVKSRNVAIQMGYPASARSSKALANYLESMRNLPGRPEGGGGKEMSRPSDISFLLNNNHRSRSDSMANAVNLGPSFTSLMRTPRSERERFFVQSTSSQNSARGLRRSNNFCSSYSDQYLGLHSGRNLAHHSLVPPTPPYNHSNHNSSDPYAGGRTSSRRRLPDPVLEELITIPPPTEFRGYPLHPTRQRDHQLDNLNARSSDYNLNRMFNNNSSDHSMYPYSNNDQSQYIYSRYP